MAKILFLSKKAKNLQFDSTVRVTTETSLPYTIL